MGMDVGGHSGGPKSEINVTPLVDVMLVLLIIMMLIAPMLQQGVSVKLPQASNSADKPETQDQTVVAVTSDRRIYLNGVPMQEAELVARIQTILETKKEKVVLIKRGQEPLAGHWSLPGGAVAPASDNEKPVYYVCSCGEACACDEGPEPVAGLGEARRMGAGV